METVISCCKNCSHALTGNYCSQCGEKRHKPEDKKIGHLLHETFHFLTHFEGSFFLTFRTAFGKPGKLSADYCDGIQKKYFKPVSFFLFSVILYLLFSSFQGLNMKFAVYVNEEYGLRFYTLEPARQKLKALGITTNELAARYDAKSPKVAKVLLFLLIPLSALVLYGLSFRKRRYYYDHFVLATEAMAIYVLGMFVLLYLLYVVVSQLYPRGETGLRIVPGYGLPFELASYYGYGLQ